MDPTFEFDSELIPWTNGQGSWVFATLPVDVADVVRDIVPTKRGFGSVRVRVRLEEIEWRTSIFPDSSSGSYVLPVKAAVRKKADVDLGDTVRLELDVLIED